MVLNKTFVLFLFHSLQAGEGAGRIRLLQWLLQGTLLPCLLQFLVAPHIPSGFPVTFATPSTHVTSLCLLPIRTLWLFNLGST